jgi:diaminopimelate decarboxylase
MALALRLGVEPGRILFTENNATDAELAEAQARGVLVNCGSLDSLQRLGRSRAAEASVRINPDVGAGEHDHTLTAGPKTKFGIHHSEVDEILRIEHETGIAVVGCHMHIGSNILDAAVFVAAMRVILDVARRLPHLRFIDFGGGLGVPYRPEERPLDLERLGREASALMESFCAEYGRRLELRLEPGRFPVAEAGTLFTMVTSVKTRPAYDGEPARCFVGCDTGFNHLLRPCLYGSYHPIDNITRPMAEPQLVDIVGNICESGDVFARDRHLPEPRPGDILAIRCAGAYGMSMASNYNLRPLPPELVLDDGEIRLVRERRSIAQLLDEWIWPTADIAGVDEDQIETR